MLPSQPGWLAVHQAAWYGQEACLKVLLSGRHTHPDTQMHTRRYTYTHSQWVTLCCCLAQPGMVNKRTERSETALMLAVSKEHLGCVQVLLENGADPDVPNKDKETPLYRGSGGRVSPPLNC